MKHALDTNRVSMTRDEAFEFQIPFIGPGKFKDFSAVGDGLTNGLVTNPFHRTLFAFHDNARVSLDLEGTINRGKPFRVFSREFRHSDSFTAKSAGEVLPLHLVDSGLAEDSFNSYQGTTEILVFG